MKCFAASAQAGGWHATTKMLGLVNILAVA
jgi:hypothetical protein